MKELFRPIGVEQLQKSDGNIVRYDAEMFERFQMSKGLFKQDKVLTSSELELVSLIFNQELNPEKEYITCKSIEIALDCKRDTLNKKFRGLKDKGFFSLKPFDKTGLPNLGVNKVYELAPFKDLERIASERVEALEDAKQRSSRQKNSELRKQVFASVNLPPEAWVDSRDLNRAIALKDINVFQKLAVPRNLKVTSHANEIHTSKGIVTVETSCVDNVFSVEDIRPLYCLITLTIKSWYNCLDYFRSQNMFPPNVLYCEISQILRMLGKYGDGKTAGGTQYATLQASMARIIGTTFKQFSGMPVINEAIGTEFTEISQFMFFEPTKTKMWGGDKVEIIHDPESGSSRAKTDVLAYRLSWEENMYKKMLTEKTFFDIPISILSADDYVFLLYMSLRSTLKAPNKLAATFSYDDLFRMIIGNGGTGLQDFREGLLTHLLSYKDRGLKKKRSLKDSEQKIEFDLEGFSLTVTRSGKRIDSLGVVLDHAKMIQSAGSLAGKGGMSLKKPTQHAAPVSVNEALDLVKQIAEQMKSGGEDVDTDLKFRLAGLEIQKPKTKGRKLIYKHPRTKAPIEFCRYTTDSEIGEFAKLCIPDEDAMMCAAVFNNVKKKVASLDYISEGTMANEEEYITQKVFGEIKSELGVASHSLLSTIDTFDTINSCPNIKHNIIKNWGDIRQRRLIIDNISHAYFSQSDVKQYDMYADSNERFIIESDATEVVESPPEVVGGKQKVKDFLNDGLTAFKMPK